MTVRRPPCRYPGAKWELAPWIISKFPAHRVYVEPFGGGASVLLRKPRAHSEVYNDVFGEIVNLFRVLRSPVDGRELARQIRFTPFARREYDSAFLAGGDPIEQARRTLVKAAMGFGSNSIMRRTGFRSGIRPQGANHATDWSRLPDALEAIAERLRGVFIEEQPAVNVMQRYDSPKTLHYVDPPYPKALRCEDFRYKCEMSDAEHGELAEALHSLKGMVIISGYACDLYDRELYPNWQRVERSTHADGGRDRVEVLWISPNAMSQPSLF